MRLFRRAAGRLRWARLMRFARKNDEAAKGREMGVSLAGKVALVTGASPHMGSGLALVLAKYGAKVACNDVRPDVADAAVRRLERNGCEAIAIPGDVTEEAEVVAYVEKVLDTWGRIDVLVNCAAILGGAGVLDIAVDAFNRQLLVQCAGMLINTKHVARSMIDRGIKGSVINIASTAAWQGAAGNVGYGTSKGAVVQFTRAAAMDLAPYGIRVNSCSPPSTQADNPELLTASREADGAAGFRPRAGLEPGRLIPMGELPTPTDHGHIVAFLASDLARLVTGADFSADGGALAKYWSYVPQEEKAGPLPRVNLDATASDA